eukprot:UN11169
MLFIFFFCLAFWAFQTKKYFFYEQSTFLFLRLFY